MGKFKVGDTVRCIGDRVAQKPSALGYKPDKEFIVNSIRKDSDGDIYFPKDECGVYECDLILVKELVKTLPKSFACTNTNQVLWNKYIKWLDGGFSGDVNTYYGINKSGDKFSCNYDRLDEFFDTILSLEEWDEIVNGTQIKTKETEEVMKKYYISRGQLKEIHDVACSGWKTTIELYSRRNPFADMIEFTQTEVDEMFKAATLDQTPVLEGIFGKQTREIDLSTGHVDGLKLFIKGEGGTIDDTLMRVRSRCEYKNKAFLLNDQFDWKIVTDEVGCKCLVPTRK